VDYNIKTISSGVIACAFVSLTQAATAVVDQDTWTGGLAGWNSVSSGGASNPVAADDLGGNTYDSVFFDVSSVGTSQYTSLYKKPGFGQNAAMGEADLNYFDQSLSINWDIGALGGTSGGGAAKNLAYLFICDSDATGVAPQTNNAAGVAVMLEQSWYGAGGYDIYKLIVRETTTGSSNETVFDLNLANPVAPTEINISFSGDGSGTSYSIDLVGAALNSGATNVTGTIAGLVESDYSGYALAIGARNEGGTVGTATTFSIEGILVTADSGGGDSVVTPPNIVLIMADDMGWRDLSCYGSEFHETTHIDQLYSESVAFTNAYASAPLCSATRAALLTGWAPARQHITGVTRSTRTASTHDFVSWEDAAIMNETASYPVAIPTQQGQLPLSSITIAERLKEAGYATGFFGKWHIGPDTDKHPQQQGFDVAKADMSLGFPKSYFSLYQNDNLTDGLAGEQLTDRLAQEACTFIRDSVAAEEPFFCYVPTFAVHAPYEAKQAYIDYFNGMRDESNPQNFATYAGMIKSLDDAVGTIVAELKAQEVYDNTIIIFTSDNGGIRMESSSKTDGNMLITSMRPLRGQKTSIYEGGIRVPTMVRWPGVTPRVTDEPIVSHDLYPTLLAAAGLEPLLGNPLDGINQKPFICDDTPNSREYITWFFPHHTLFGTPDWNRSGAVIRKGKWKLLHFWDAGNNPFNPWPNELYDLDADIGETVDLAQQHPDVVAELEALLLAELNAQNAHIPIASSKYNPADWQSLWDSKKAASEYLWHTQQGTPLMWLEDYELIDGYEWHAAEWADPDGDGVPSWQAYDAGAMPVPFVVSVDASGAQIDLRYPVRKNYLYTIWASELLSNPDDWQEVATETASSNGFSEVSLPVGSEAQLFYRVEETEGIASLTWDESFDGASLNANWTPFTQGAGAAASQVGGQLVLDSGVALSSAQAALNTTTNQDGASTFNGQPFYNFYQHPVSMRFDIASISGVNGGGKNVFYCSIGEDAAGKYQPQQNALDDEIGFCLQQEGDPATWSVVYQALDGAQASGGTVAILSGPPSAITYVLNGTQGTIQLEGATIAAVGSAGSGTVGGVELSVALADLSANISSYTMAFGAWNFGTVDEKTVVTLDAVSIVVGE
jgi:arylsulfatase A